MKLFDWQTVCKLTGENGYTLNETKWEAGTINPKGVLTGEGGLCWGGFYHAYHTPELAAFLNPVGAGFIDPRFWEAEIRGTVEADTGILKLGATEMRIVREITPILPTRAQRIAFGIYCASAALAATNTTIPVWEAWRDGWLWEGRRGADAADASDAANAIVYTAADAANAIVYTAASAYYAAYYAAVYAADSYADYYAARAAECAARVDPAIVLDAATFALSEDLYD